MVTRIRELLDYKSLTPTQFADLVGVGRPVMSHILSERNKPSLEVVQRIISAFPELSLPWLLSGTGSMLGAEAPAPPTAFVEASALAAAPSPAVLPIVSASVFPPSATQGSSAPVLPQNLAAESGPIAADAPVTPPAAVSVGVAPPVVPAAAQVSETPTHPAPSRFRAPQAGPSVPAATAVAIPAASLAGPPALQAPALPARPAGILPGAPEAAMLPFLAEPGKLIRRIVIFYRDGSFADYQPEQ